MSTGDEGLNPRAVRMRALLERIADLVVEQFGERPQAILPPDPAGIPDMPGRVVTAEVRDLYSIAGGGGAYRYWIARPTRLPAVNDEADEFMSEYPAMDIGDLPWGPPPLGEALVVLEASQPVYVSELNGQPSGVTVLDVGGDEGYHWMAPSLERLFETWVALTEAGLNDLHHDTAGGAHIGLRLSDDRVIDKARDICHRHSCGLAAAGIWGLPQ